MATKTSVFKQENKSYPIEFCLVYDGKIADLSLTKPRMEPNKFDNILLLKKGNKPYVYDVMYAYNESTPQSGWVYYGWWNDGKAE